MNARQDLVDVDNVGENSGAGFAALRPKNIPPAGSC
jgi:hypothetical protein